METDPLVIIHSEGVSASSHEGKTYRLPECQGPPFDQGLAEDEGLNIIYQGKKAPTEFIHIMDWGIYLRLCCQLRHLKTTYCCTEKEAQQLLQKRRSCRRNCIIRLIIAFNHLYSEYSKVVDLASWIQKTTATEKGGITKVAAKSKMAENHEQLRDLSPTFPAKIQGVSEHHNNKCLNRGDAKSPIISAKIRSVEQNICQPSVRPQAGDDEGTHPYNQSSVLHTATVFKSASTLLDIPAPHCSYSTQVARKQVTHYRDDTHNQGPHACFRWCHRSSKCASNSIKYRQHAKEALRLAKELNTFRNFSNKHGCSECRTNEPFDCIQREPEENTLMIYQLVGYQYRVEHKLKLSEHQFSSFTQLPTHPADRESLINIRLPLALELVLPKVQRQIEQVLRSCNFVYDPLEVAAELRQLNYDTEACISYFNKTRFLREVIHEFLPNCVKSGAHSASGKTHSKYYATLSPAAKGLPSDSGHNVKSQLAGLRDQLALLRKAQQGANRRITQLRQFVSAMGKHMGKALEEAIIPFICTSSRLENLLGSHRADLTVTQLSKLAQENRSLKLTLRMEENRRKTVFNMMQEYLGNVRVYCRCRAVSHSVSCLETPSIDTVLLNNGLDTNIEQFKFDRVFDVGASQAEVYTELAPSVCSFLDGYNVCFLTYGGEASGKTHTLLGPPMTSISSSTQGITQRALHTVLAEREARQHDLEYRLAVAVIEVYNDTLIDLLANEQGVHIHIDSGLEQVMEGLESMEIHKESDVEHLVTVCQARRRTGCTALNTQSSRSHLIIFAKLNARSRLHEAKWCSVLALCDLAGFEDIIKADTLSDPVLAKEAGYINRSLTALNRVFMALRTQEPSTVSYRDSKLTYLLKPFFVHSGKCILIVTVRTDRANLASTQGTLRFGREARGVSLGRQRRQFNLDRLIDDMHGSG
ncbi:unnamed protein product [Dicrocoelium dendriticum]|nr:unnamed protein product [Dicrocoelium dendriticum]